MLALVSVGLLWIGFVVNGLGEFRKSVTARRVGLSLAVPSLLFAVYLLVGVAVSGVDIVLLVSLTMIGGFVLSVVGESKENRKLRIAGLLLQLPMIIFGALVIFLMLAFSHL